MILHVTFLYVYVFDEKKKPLRDDRRICFSFLLLFFLFVRRGVLTIQNGVLKTF